MSAACGYSVKIKIEICTNGATTLSRMNLSGYIGHVTILSLMFTVVAFQHCIALYCIGGFDFKAGVFLCMYRFHHSA